MSSVSIRPYRATDDVAIAELEARVRPYRPADEPEVLAMFERSLRAEQNRDPRWMGPVKAPLRPVSEEFDAFWVAEGGYGESKSGHIVGTVGVQTFTPEGVIPINHPLVLRWQRRGHVVELRKLRVAPEARGHGLGTRLCGTVIRWCQDQQVSLIVVNTTTAQTPALNLYRKLGFCDVGHSFIGRFELTWLELEQEPDSRGEGSL